MNKEIRKELMNLALNRISAADFAAKKKALVERLLEKNEEYISVKYCLETYSTEIAAGEARVRELALAEYQIAKEKQIIPDVLYIKNATVVDYDAARAREWCLHNFTPALSLDTKAFEAIAKQKGRIPADLATVKDEPKAYIATNLSQWANEAVEQFQHEAEELETANKTAAILSDTDSAAAIAAEKILPDADLLEEYNVSFAKKEAVAPGEKLAGFICSHNHFRIVEEKAICIECGADVTILASAARDEPDDEIPF